MQHKEQKSNRTRLGDRKNMTTRTCVAEEVDQKRNKKVPSYHSFVFVVWPKVDK